MIFQIKLKTSQNFLRMTNSNIIFVIKGQTEIDKLQKDFGVVGVKLGA